MHVSVKACGLKFTDTFLGGGFFIFYWSHSGCVVCLLSGLDPEDLVEGETPDGRQSDGGRLARRGGERSTCLKDQTWMRLFPIHPQVKTKGIKSAILAADMGSSFGVHVTCKA